MTRTTFDLALDAVEGLPEDEQIEPLDVVRRRLAERGRRRVIKEVTETKAEFEKGLAKPTSVDELMRDRIVRPTNPALRAAAKRVGLG